MARHYMYQKIKKIKKIEKGRKKEKERKKKKVFFFFSKQKKILPFIQSGWIHARFNTNFACGFRTNVLLASFWLERRFVTLNHKFSTLNEKKMTIKAYRNAWHSATIGSLTQHVGPNFSRLSDRINRARTATNFKSYKNICKNSNQIINQIKN